MAGYLKIRGQQPDNSPITPHFIHSILHLEKGQDRQICATIENLPPYGGDSPSRPKLCPLPCGAKPPNTSPLSDIALAAIERTSEPSSLAPLSLSLAKPQSLYGPSQLICRPCSTGGQTKYPVEKEREGKEGRRSQDVGTKGSSRLSRPSSLMEGVAGG